MKKTKNRKRTMRHDLVHYMRTKEKTCLHALLEIVRLKDPHLLCHCESVANISLKIGKELKLPGDQLDHLRQAGLLHDIGKVLIDGYILNKNEILTEAEFIQIKTHPERGMRMLAAFGSPEYLVDAAWHHHEHYDGTGYPDGLSGETIHLFTRIISLADAIDAMSEDRPYREHLKDWEIISELEKGRGSQFDPLLVDIAVGLIKNHKFPK